MLTREICGNSFEIITDVIGGKTFTEVAGEMSCERSVTPAKKDAREESLAAIAVECDDRVDMTKKVREEFRM